MLLCIWLLGPACIEKPSASPSLPEAQAPTVAALAPKPAPVVSPGTPELALPVNAGHGDPPDAVPAPGADSAIPAQVAVDWQSVDQAMSFFVKALHDKNAEALLRCFSRKKGFLLTGTADTPHDSMRFSYARLEKGLQPGGDFVGIIFGGEGDDNFRDYVEQARAASWKSKGPMVFVPPDEHSRPVFVRWRKEGARYVVEEIAFPAG